MSFLSARAIHQLLGQFECYNMSMLIIQARCFGRCFSILLLLLLLRLILDFLERHNMHPSFSWELTDAEIKKRKPPSIRFSWHGGSWRTRILRRCHPPPCIPDRVGEGAAGWPSPHGQADGRYHINNIGIRVTFKIKEQNIMQFWDNC